MPVSSTATAEGLDRTRGFAEASRQDAWSLSSAVSWGAVLAGAAAAASLSLILLILGVGLGLSSVSPWAQTGVSATSFGGSTIGWLTFTSLAASGLGGYLTGRLRTKWTEVDRDEAYFRDTAHGFLAWAVASLATAGLMTSVIGSILSGGVQAGASAVGGAAGPAGLAVGRAAASQSSGAKGDAGTVGYFVDSLFRRDAAAAGATAAPAAAGTGPASAPPVAFSADTDERAAGQDAAEAGRIFTHVARSEALPPDDLRHVGQMVARRTGLSQQEAERRAADVFAKARQTARDAELAVRDAADKARKASAYGALWLFVSLLVGAFVASLAATFGGQRRDA